MAEKLIKQRGIGAMQDNTCQDNEFVGRALALNLKIRELGLQGKPKTQEEMQDRITQYFSLCQEAQLNPTVEGLALAVNYDRRSLFEIGKGTFNQPFMDIIKNAKDFIANYDAILAASNKMNSAVYCFRSKNFYRNERFRYSRGSFKSVRGCSKPDRGRTRNFARSSSD